jgi:hypothetical protein
LQEFRLAHYLIRAAEQRERHGSAERLGRLEVDDQFERGGLLHWQLGRLLDEFAAFQRREFFRPLDRRGISSGD